MIGLFTLNQVSSDEAAPASLPRAMLIGMTLKSVSALSMLVGSRAKKGLARYAVWLAWTEKVTLPVVAPLGDCRPVACTVKLKPCVVGGVHSSSIQKG